MNKLANKNQAGRHLKGFGETEKPTSKRYLLALVPLIALFASLLYFGLSTGSPKEIPPPPLETPQIEADISQLYTLSKSGELLVEEFITVNNAISHLKHGISRRLPRSISFKPPGMDNEIVFKLDTEIIERSVLQEGIKIAGIQHRETGSWEDAYDVHYIGGENLELDNLTYTFVFKYKVKNLKQIFHSEAAFVWQILDGAGFKVKSYHAQFIFPPYLESENISFTAKLLEAKLNPETGTETVELPYLDIGKIFPANNENEEFRKKEIVVTTVALTQALGPYQRILASIKVPGAYIEP